MIESTHKSHGMSHEQASKVKLGGHNNERDFNSAFGNKMAELNFSGPSSDCIILDKNLIVELNKKLGIISPFTSVKGGDTIQIHLGSFPELTNMDFWNKNLCQKKISTGKTCTSSKHGISFLNQKKVLKSYSFWKKYLGKGDVLAYRRTESEWIFFNMEDVINFIVSKFDWRLLETGRLKGDYLGKQYLTYEYRSEDHKLCFVLGAHGGKKGREFMEMLIKHIPFCVKFV